MRALGEDQVFRVAVSSVWYAVDRISLAAGSDGLECGAVRRSRLGCGQTTILRGTGRKSIPFGLATITPPYNKASNSLHDVHSHGFDEAERKERIL